MGTEKLSDFLSQFDKLTKKPELFISCQEEQTELIKLFMRDLYNFTKKKENPKNKSLEALEELIIADFDEEQIWQQIDLQNNSVFNSLVHSIAHLLAKKESLIFPLKAKQKKKLQSDNDKLKTSTQGIAQENEIISQTTKKKRVKPLNKKSSIVNDKFFKLYEMEEFLKKVEQGKEINEYDNPEINYFEEDCHEEIEDNIKELHYNDFFDQPDSEEDHIRVTEETETKRVKFNLKDQEDEDKYANTKDIYKFKNVDSCEEDDYNEGSVNEMENDNDDVESVIMTNNFKQPSSFEIRQERLKLRIQNLEDEALKEKPWQLKGEVTANNRPQNSLLEEYVEFDVATRPAPVLTEKSTLKLEDVITQRIKDKSWDDVTRKFKPHENEIEYKKKLVLDQEKSKLSLAQIYEQEYLNKLDNKNESEVEKPDIELPEHQEIRTMMNKLFFKLDALSNFHFTPKQVKPEVKIISNLPAINMEEVAPVAVSDATLLAPEEVKPKFKGDLLGKTERTAADKKRERRQKKLKQKLKLKKKEVKVKMKEEKLESKNTQKKKISQKLLQKIIKNSNITPLEENKSDKYVKSSNAFFSKLQTEITNEVKKKKLNLKKVKLSKARENKSKNY